MKQCIHTLSHFSNQYKNIFECSKCSKIFKYNRLADEFREMKIIEVKE